MALNGQQLGAIIGGSWASNTARLDAAAEYAAARVERIRGPEFDPDRPVMTAEWDILSRVGGWPLTLAVNSPIASVEQVRVGSSVRDESGYAVRQNVGLLEVRTWLVWNTTVAMDYTPVDDRKLRESVQADIGAMYMGAASMFGPSGEHASRPEFNRDAMEARALRRLELIGMSVRRPSRVFYKAGQGGG